MTRTFAVTNQKGGVGKTTTCAALCGAFSARGGRVLAVALDPQGNLSFILGAETDGCLTVHDLFTGAAPVRDIIQHRPTADVLSSNILLSGAELELTQVRREYLLREALEEVADDYDYIVIDTPPALSVLTINAYAAATDLIIPMTAEILSLQGIAQLKDTILAVRKYYNPALVLSGILLTRYNRRTLLHREVEELAGIVASQLGTKVFDTKVSVSIAIAESPAPGMSVLAYAPRAKGARDYRRFVRELLGEPLEEDEIGTAEGSKRN